MHTLDLYVLWCPLPGLHQTEKSNQIFELADNYFLPHQHGDIKLVVRCIGKAQACAISNESIHHACNTMNIRILSQQINHQLAFAEKLLANSTLCRINAIVAPHFALLRRTILLFRTCNSDINRSHHGGIYGIPTFD